MADTNANFSIDTTSEVFLILVTAVAVLYGLFLVIAIFTTGIATRGIGLGIALLLFVQAAQSLYTITQ
ncbi:hypothetical protein C5B89_09485 [Haloferax sp. Atlit-47N]|nr:hypothetical protein DEQ67_08225 [Haloferax sp. Atlit-48N]RDZ38780.1 hypothetical protein C5B89_09485 [Haloferax sp. Atlit-47N]